MSYMAGSRTGLPGTGSVGQHGLGPLGHAGAFAATDPSRKCQSFCTRTGSLGERGRIPQLRMAGLGTWVHRSYLWTRGCLECESSPGPEEASPELRAGEQREGAIERWATPRAPGRRPPAHGFFPRAQPEPGAVALRTFVRLV